MTTDMGPELGLSSFHGCLEDYLPMWHPWHSSEPRFLPDDAQEAGEVLQERALLPNCVALPGLCHTMDNLLQDVDERLPSWTEYFKELKNVSAVLNRDQARCRLYTTCVQGRAPVRDEKLWQHSPPNLYEQRWGQVVAFLQRALPMMKVLRGAWNKDLYQAPGSGAGQDASAGIVFDVNLFSHTLASPRFFLYSEMILQLHSLCGDLQGMLESCPCHSHLLHGKGQSQRLSVLKEDYDADVGSCVLAGMRAPELAAGFLQQQLVVTKRQRRDLLLELASGAQGSVGCWPAVLKEYDEGALFMEAALEVKIAFWHKLPYCLAGLAHIHSSVAQQCAQHCIDTYEASKRLGAEAVDSIHHPILSHSAS